MLHVCLGGSIFGLNRGLHSHIKPCLKQKVDTRSKNHPNSDNSNHHHSYTTNGAENCHFSHIFVLHIFLFLDLYCLQISNLSSKKTISNAFSSYVKMYFRQHFVCVFVSTSDSRESIYKYYWKGELFLLLIYLQ